MSCPEGCWLRQDQSEDDSIERLAHIHVEERHIPVQPPSEVSAQLYGKILPWQTRVLCLEPGQFHEPLQGQLLVADLIHFDGLGIREEAKIVTYKALSYCWGDTTYEHLVWCNGLAVGVTENLWTALRYIRSTSEAVYIWVDALCINQSDAAEKSQQVRRMMVLYEKAEQVIAWLGASSSSTAFAVGLLRFKSSILPSIHNLEEHTERCRTNLAYGFRALRHLINSPWFSRTWVRQEVFAARDLVLQCGHVQTRLEVFKDLHLVTSDLQRLFEHLSLLYADMDTFHVPEVVDSMCRSRRRKLTESMHNPSQKPRAGVTELWMELLISGMIFDCAEPRDRVYAYAGMVDTILKERLMDGWAKAPRIQQLEIDYGKTSADVCRDITMHLVNATGSLSCLQILESRHDRVVDVPTWVTDWREIKDRFYLYISDDNDYTSLNVPLVTLPRHTPPTFSFVASCRGSNSVALKCHGNRLGIVPPGSYTVFNDISGHGYGDRQDRLLNVYPAQKRDRYYRTAKWASVALDVSGRLVEIQVAKGVERGDILVALEGSELPMMLRRHEDMSSPAGNIADVFYTFHGPALCVDPTLYAPLAATQTETFLLR